MSTGTSKKNEIIYDNSSLSDSLQTSSNTINIEEKYPNIRFIVDTESIPFPKKLMKMLSRNDWNDIISWAPGGKSFKIHDREKFMKVLCPTYYFEETKYDSFRRKLNRWGFKIVKDGDDAGAFHHEYFLRDNPSLCSKITRTNSKKEKDNGDEALNTERTRTNCDKEKKDGNNLSNQEIYNDEKLNNKSTKIEKSSPHLSDQSHLSENKRKELMQYLNLKRLHNQWLSRELFLQKKINSLEEKYNIEKNCNKKEAQIFTEHNSRTSAGLDTENVDATTVCSTNNDLSREVMSNNPLLFSYHKRSLENPTLSIMAEKTVDLDQNNPKILSYYDIMAKRIISNSSTIQNAEKDHNIISNRTKSVLQNTSILSYYDRIAKSINDTSTTGLNIEHSNMSTDSITPDSLKNTIMSSNNSLLSNHDSVTKFPMAHKKKIKMRKDSEIEGRNTQYSTEAESRKKRKNKRAMSNNNNANAA